MTDANDEKKKKKLKEQEAWTLPLMWAIRDGRGTKNGERLILLLLALRVDPKSFCFPGVPQIADDAQLSESSVTRMINGLVSKHLVHRIRRGGRRNLYRLNDAVIFQQAREANTNRAEAKAFIFKSKSEQIDITTGKICETVREWFPDYPWFNDPGFDVLEIEPDIEACVQIAGNPHRCMQLISTIMIHESEIFDRIQNSDDIGEALQEAITELLPLYASDLAPMTPKEGSTHE
jgi:DNA-binding MarR family transcriptional regulator